MLIGFINAYSVSLSDLLSQVDEQTLIIFLVFIISFTLIYFALSKFFKDKNGYPNKGMAAVISFALSFGLTYAANKSEFDIAGWVYNLGISREILYVLIPILAVVVVIFLIVKLKRNSLFVFGGLFLASALFVYEKTIMIIVGAVLILVRLFWGNRDDKDDLSYLGHYLRKKKGKRWLRKKH